MKSIGIENIEWCYVCHSIIFRFSYDKLKKCIIPNVQEKKAPFIFPASELRNMQLFWSVSYRMDKVMYAKAVT
jgi:hypothetical protein